MEAFKPLACDLSLEWVKFLRIGRNGLVVGVGCQSVARGCDDRAVSTLFESILNIRSQASHCHDCLSCQMNRRYQYESM